MTDVTNEGAEPVSEKQTTPPGSEAVHAALLAHLSRIRSQPPQVKAPQSMQPTPEAAKTRAARLRRKRRILIQKSKHRDGVAPP